MSHADHDILHMLEHSVPPADVTKVALFSSPLAKFKHEAGPSMSNEHLHRPEPKCSVSESLAGRAEEQ